MTVFARGIDYAWQHPDPAAIKAAGYDFVCRYYSRDPSKNLTRAEADALTAEGLWIVGNWEYYANDALGGYAAGVANAKLARSLADACGQPAARPIYGSDDWDVTPAQEPIVTDYLRGWDSVLGVGEVGEYAGFYPLRVQRDAGVTSWEWQPLAWSGGQWEPRVNIRQTGFAVVGGVQVDVNEAWTADYGQWQPGRLPLQSPLQEVAMQDVLLAVADGPDAGGIWLRTSDGQYGHVPDIPTRDALVALLGAQEKTISGAVHQMFLAMAAPAALTTTDAQAQVIASAIAAGLPHTLTLTGTETVTETGKLG